VVARSDVAALEHGAHPSDEPAALDRFGEGVLPSEIQGFFLALAVLCGKEDDRVGPPRIRARDGRASVREFR
jgi:hypothetical protein